jgi:hypothetical protein
MWPVLMLAPKIHKIKPNLMLSFDLFSVTIFITLHTLFVVMYIVKEVLTLSSVGSRNNFIIYSIFCDLCTII